MNNSMMLTNKVIQREERVPLLDLYPGAIAAYSLRKLNSAYTGPCITIRWGSNNWFEIGFKDNKLDLDYIKQVVPASESAFIYIWHDQSGNGRDLINGTWGQQPRIITINDQILNTNSEPAVFFDSGDFIASPIGNPINSPVTHFTVFNLGSNANNQQICCNSNASAFMVGTFDAKFRVYNGSSSTFDHAIANKEYLVSTTFGSTTTDRVILNNSIYTHSNTGNLVGDRISLGARPDGQSRLLNGYIKEYVLYASDKNLELETIHKEINSHYKIYWDGSKRGLLNEYPNASAAYSLRNLNSNYTGPLIRVRRSSDNLEYDIYGTYDGTLDVNSLQEFCGITNDGFISRWYDQSGTGNDAIQASASSQPLIINQGIIHQINDKPALKLDLGDFLVQSSNIGISGNNPHSIYLMHYPTNNDSTNNFIMSGPLSMLVFQYIVYPGNGDVRFGSGPTLNQQQLLTLSYPSGATFNYEYLLHKNNTFTPSSSNTPGLVNLSDIPLRIGAHPNRGDRTYQGSMQEFIIFNSDQLSNRDNIQSNISDFYKAYFNPISNLDPDYLAVLNRANSLGYSLPSPMQQAKQNRLVLDLKAANVWNKLDVMYVFATDGGNQFARLNWKNPLNHECTIRGTLNFENNVGFRTRLDTNFNPAVSGVNYTLDNAGRFMYITVSGSLNYDGISNTFANTLVATTSSAQRINQGTANLNALIPMSGDGWKTINRTSSTNVELFNHLTQYSATANSVSIISSNQLIQEASGGTEGTMTHGFYAMGGSLVAENTAFYNAVTKYISSL